MRASPSNATYRTLFVLALAGIVGLLVTMVVGSLDLPNLAASGSQPFPTAHVLPPQPDLSRRAVVIGPAPAVLAAAPTSQPAADQPAAPVDATSQPAPEPAQVIPSTTPEQLPPVSGPQPDATPPATQPAQSPAQPQGELRAGPVPIVMYHYVRSVDPSVDPLGYNLSIAPDLFAQHLAWLHENGYTTLRMDTVGRCLRGEPLCPPRSVALTFDDGYADAYTDALPALQSYGFTATFYVINHAVGTGGYLTWEQVAALRDAGMEIGAHTLDHYDLTIQTTDEAYRQIAESKTDLEQHLGIAITSFCYPVGLYNAAVAAQVAQAGYSNATTTRWDSDNTDIFALPRRRISGGTDVSSFAAIVGG